MLSQRERERLDQRALKMLAASPDRRREYWQREAYSMAELWVKHLVTRMNYRPGVEVFVMDSNAFLDRPPPRMPFVAVTAHVECRVPDARYWQHVDDPRYVAPLVTIARMVRIDWADLELDDVKYPVQRIKDGIREMEIHEFEEWVRFDGERLCDPHPELGPTLVKEPKK